MKKQSYYLIFIFLFCLGGIQAQDAILTSGGDASGSGGSFSYSVGQIVYTTIIDSNGSMAQGVQQPFEISAVLGVDDLLGINLSLVAYPNPTTDFLNLTIANLNYKNLSYQLFDINGRLLAQKKLENNSNEITMKQFPSALYFLKIFNNQKLVKLFKIIKTQ
ncbi:MAG: T9SS type A sorting domain-containing protein [Bacteroidetes bacterium]|nr:T9SS type A sorting domain-containing protein [Bacteroidota bacterium]PIZ06112.1 MAG: hypothetical protein COY57_03735 [Flavobacteriales bacterium CG_4_10_14_0_8_um_filter_32_5]